MTSCGGGDDGGGRSPPPVVYDNLVEVREQAARLESMLVSPNVAAVDAREVVKGMMAKLSSTMSVLSTSGGAESSSSGAGRGPGGRRKRSGAAAAAGPHRRSSSRRRTKSPFIKMVTATKLNDGNSWRKYGQKKIHDSTKPRSYYRCTHKPEQGCMATRQVQESESDASEFVISYYGEHTCRDPASFTSSLMDQGAAAAAATALSDGANLISFAPINGAASTSTFPHRLGKEKMEHSMLLARFPSYSSSPAPEGASQGTPSGSSSPACYEKFMQYAGGQLADVLGRTTSPLTVGSAPAEYWPVEGVAGVVLAQPCTAGLPRRAATGSCQARSDRLAIALAATTTCLVSIPDDG